MKWLVLTCLALFPDAIGGIDARQPVATIAMGDGSASCAETARCSQGCPADRLASCVDDCATRLSTKARPYYEALQSCSKRACIEACKDAASTSCKLCVMGKCSGEVSSCLVH